MSANVAELTLILKAKNLAETELAKVRDSISKVSTTARQVASDVASAFKGIGSRIVGELGNLAGDLLSGGNIVNSGLAVGATLAGAMVEGLSVHFIPEMLAKVGATATFAPMAAALSAEGTGLGGILAAAIPIGMAALPFLLAAAAVAAFVALAVNPELRQKVHDIAANIVTWLVERLKDIVQWFLDLPGKIADVGSKIVGAIIGGMISLPGKLADVIRDAFARLDITIGPFHITGHGITIDFGHTELKNIPGATPGSNPRGLGHAAGGWVGLHGPELAIVGEQGPEFIVPNGGGTGGGGGVRIQGVSEADILDMVDRGLYFRLQRAAPTLGRS